MGDLCTEVEQPRVRVRRAILEQAMITRRGSDAAQPRSSVTATDPAGTTYTSGYGDCSLFDAVGLVVRVHKSGGTVALANKLARIAWAVLHRSPSFKAGQLTIAE
jgi:hypothetical protein